MFAPSPALAARPDQGFPSAKALSAKALPMLDETEVARVARTDACVLFTGSPHTRNLALRIHNQSGWRWGPFHAVDCAAPDAILEQQLFQPLMSDLSPVDDSGPRIRLLQAGTLFLHEVGCLSAAAQVRLRDLIGESRRNCRSRRRIMASMSGPLYPRVVDGTFDQCLFYRLNVMHFPMTGA